MAEVESGICGREKEIKQIRQFINSRIEAQQPGILYLAGPPGTGKTMSIRYVLDQINEKTIIPQLSINCFKEQSSKTMVSKMCQAFDCSYRSSRRCNETETISRIARKLTGINSSTHIIVLDEMDQLPKSKTIDLIRTIFSWPSQANSKLILIGIANTVNLTSRYQVINSITGNDQNHLEKILFRPYSSKDIRAILEWYLLNDENFEDASLEPKALDLISMTYARENGDIRGALNALKSTVDDTVKEEKARKEVVHHSQVLSTEYPTPPSTPPPCTPCTPCKNKTNTMSVVRSIKKRQRATNYMEDKFPFMHQIILTCIQQLSFKLDTSSVDASRCRQLVLASLEKFKINFSSEEYKSMLDMLESQGFIARKKGNPRDKIVLKATESELSMLIVRRDMIVESINNLV